MQQNSSQDFDALCAKIASGQATQEEINMAFANLNQEIAAFSSDINKQLDKTDFSG